MRTPSEDFGIDAIERTVGEGDEETAWEESVNYDEDDDDDDDDELPDVFASPSTQGSFDQLLP